LYFEIAAHANRMADILRECLTKLGYPFYIEGVTNQLFPILPDAVLEKLDGVATYSNQARIDDTHRAVRFCTSWATKEKDVLTLCETLEKLSR
jgi:threonine aldolase